MRGRSLSLSAFVVFGLALLLPATTLAGPGLYSYAIKYDYCDRAILFFKIKYTVAGASDANRITIDAWGRQRYQGVWHTHHHWPTKTYTFTNNGHDHSLAVIRDWDENPGQVTVRMRAWLGRILLDDQKVRSIICDVPASVAT